MYRYRKGRKGSIYVDRYINRDIRWMRVICREDRRGATCMFVMSALVRGYILVLRHRGVTCMFIIAVTAINSTEGGLLW